MSARSENAPPAATQQVPRVSAIVPSWNTAELLLGCLAALERAAREVPLEVIVVDDASSDGSPERVAAAFPRARLVRFAENRGYSAATNAGLALARGEYALLLNSDAEIEGPDLARLVARLDADARLSAVAPRLVGPDGATQHALMNLPRRRTALWFGTPLGRWFPGCRELRRYQARDVDPELPQEVEQPPAACLLVRRALLERLGGLDESLVVFFSDVDLCRRIRAEGGRIAYEPRARARHLGGASTAHLESFVRRWHTDRLRYYAKTFGASGAAAAKLGSALAFADHAARQGLRRLAGRPTEPIASLARDLLALLRAPGPARVAPGRDLPRRGT